MGATPVEIVQRFPTLDIASTYEVIAYVLRNRADVDAYLADHSRVAAEVQAEVESRDRVRALADPRLLRG